MQVQTPEQTLFYFLIMGKSRFPPKKFYNINYLQKKNFHGRGGGQVVTFYSYDPSLNPAEAYSFYI